MKKNKFELLIYKSFDAALSPEESELLNGELERSEAFRKKYEEIRQLRNTISRSAETSFDPFFEQRVLNSLNRDPVISKPVNGITDSLFYTFRKVALIAAVILIALISYNIASGENYSLENILGTYKPSLEYAFDSTYRLIGSGI